MNHWDLSAEAKLLLLDWCEANYGTPASGVIEEALAEHINGRLDREPEMKKRFKAAQARRTGGLKPKIVPIKEPGDGS